MYGRDSVRRLGVGVLVVLTVAALAGCGGDTEPEASPTSSTSSRATTPAASRSEPEPTNSLAAVRDTAIDTYLDMWHAYVEAARTQDPDVQTLSQYAAGDAFDQLAGALAENRKQNEVTRGDPEFDPEVRWLEPKDDPKRAKIVDCADSSDWLQYDAKTGERIKDQPAGSHRVTAVVKQVPRGGWKVTSLTIGEVGSC